MSECSLAKNLILKGSFRVQSKWKRAAYNNYLTGRMKLKKKSTNMFVHLQNNHPDNIRKSIKHQWKIKEVGTGWHCCSHSLGYNNNFQPLWVCINHYQKVFSEKWTCMVDVKFIDQCLHGHSHGCNGADGGACLVCWHCSHNLTPSSKSLSKSATIQTILPTLSFLSYQGAYVASCRTFMTASWPCGLTTLSLVPNMVHSSWTLSSSFLLSN